MRTDIPVSRELARSMYDLILRTRLFEDEIYYICSNQTPHNPFIMGKGYLSTGQEGITVGCALALTPDDWFAQSHRDMAAHLHRGVSILEAFYQYRGTQHSPTQGKDGNVHFMKPGTNMVGFTSHMGQNAAVGVGLAWAQLYTGTKNVVLCTFGEGASQQGIIHETMNYAATFNLPLVFVINNNQWAISVPVSEQMKITDLAVRGAAYDMPATIVDGNDAVAVYQAVQVAVDRARAGGGPTLIECKSMRIMGHGSHDPATYVPQCDKETWRGRDPVERLKCYLMEHDWLTETEDVEWRARIKAEIDKAVDIAGDDAPPDLSVATSGVFSTPVDVE